MAVTTRAHLTLTREEILSFRRRTGALERRVPITAASLRPAAWAGLQDSVPRAALLALHARLAGVAATDWEHPALVQVWGPRYTAFVVPERDRAVFTLGRLAPEASAARQRAERLAARIADVVGDSSVPYGQVGRALGVNPNSLRYAATTGTILIRWAGAGRPEIRVARRPDGDPRDARLELVRRYLHVVGPGTSAGFARWAGLRGHDGAAAFDALADSLILVSTPVGDGWMLATDEGRVRAAPAPAASARLLPSGDPYHLLWGRDRELLLPREADRNRLWTPRVWPGAVLVGGEVSGIWRRDGHRVRIETFAPLSTTARSAVEAEAAALPLAGLDAPIDVQWMR